MSRAEKVFWIVLELLAGFTAGFIAAQIMFGGHNTVAKCDNGISEQIEVETTYNFATGETEKKPVRKKTYIPANDTCKEEKNETKK